MKTFKQFQEGVVRGKPWPGTKDLYTDMMQTYIKGGLVHIQKGSNGMTLKKSEAKPYLKQGWKLDKDFYKKFKIPKDYYKGLE